MSAFSTPGDIFNPFSTPFLRYKTAKSVHLKVVMPQAAYHGMFLEAFVDAIMSFNGNMCHMVIRVLYPTKFCACSQSKDT